MQTITKIIEYILESNIINFAIMIWLFAFLCKKFDFASVFNNLIKNVVSQIDNSNTEKQKSEKLVNDAEQLIEKLPFEIQEIEQNNKQKLEGFKKHINESTQKNIEKITQDINKINKIDERTISYLATKYCIEESTQKAKEEILKMLEANPELHKNFIDESLMELEAYANK